LSSIRSLRAPVWSAARARLAAAAAAAIATVAAGALATPAGASLSALGPIDPATQVPAWFQDSTGLQLGLCLEGPPFCLTDAAEFNAPDGEAFWWQAGADVSLGGTAKAKLTLAQEATNPPGGRAAFMRVRVDIIGGRPNTRYSVTHPFGSTTIDTSPDGGGRDVVDTGCTLGPCPTFAGALSGAIGPFLRWDPTVAPAVPAGYVGDSATPHRVTGGTNGNVFSVSGGGASASTDEFTVAGKLAGPPVPVYEGPRSMGFGSTPPGVSVVKTVPVTSFGVPDVAGRSNLALGQVGVSGDNAAEFAVVGDTCTGRTLPSGAGCAVSIRFTPGAAGARSAVLSIPHNAAGGATQVALSGAGASAAAVAHAAAARRLTVAKLRTTHRMSRARVLRRGLRLSMRVPAGAEILKIAIYRVRHGKAQRRPVWLGYRLLSHTGLHRMRLDSRALRRRLKTGLYQVNVTPGISRHQLGRTTTTRIRITHR
jgi:hypothetical protein